MLESLSLPFLMAYSTSVPCQLPQSRKPILCNKSLNTYPLLVLFLWLNPTKSRGLGNGGLHEEIKAEEHAANGVLTRE